MATHVTLDPITERAMDELIGSGSYASREDVLREGVRLVRLNEGFDAEVDDGEVDDATRAAVERGVADIKAGRARPVADVFATCASVTNRADESHHLRRSRG